MNALKIAVLGAITGALFAVGVVFAVILVGPTQVTVRPVPACQEDEVIIGRGDFHATGYWDRYVCVNVDEVTPTTWREPVWFPTPSPEIKP